MTKNYFGTKLVLIEGTKKGNKKEDKINIEAIKGRLETRRTKENVKVMLIKKSRNIK